MNTQPQTLQWRPARAKGTGRAIGHHGEIVQGMFPTRDGGFCRGLITLPCEVFHATATFAPEPEAPLRSVPAGKAKALEAAALTLKELGQDGWGGILSIDSNIPLRWGLGSSTADVTATVRAVCDAFGGRLPAERIARLAVAAETASDPIMFDDCAMVFAHRGGHVIETLPGGLPPLTVLGFRTTEEDEGVDTLSHPPASYDEMETRAFRPVVGLLRRAAFAGDSALLGRAASASARINQRFLPRRHLAGLERIAAEAGGVGLQVAHSGIIAGILFDPRSPDLHRRVDAARHGLADLGITEAWCFRTAGDDARRSR